MITDLKLFVKLQYLNLHYLNDIKNFLLKYFYISYLKTLFYHLVTVKHLNHDAEQSF